MRKIEHSFWDSMGEPADRRRRRLERFKTRLGRSGWPRLTMAAIMILTWATWFLSSVGLLAIGIESMPLRISPGCWDRVPGIPRHVVGVAQGCDLRKSRGGERRENILRYSGDENRNCRRLDGGLRGTVSDHNNVTDPRGIAQTP